MDGSELGWQTDKGDGYTQWEQTENGGWRYKMYRHNTKRRMYTEK